MPTCDDLQSCLRDALNHLYDPAYDPPELLWRVLGQARESGVESIRKAITEAICALEPGPQVPSGALLRRVYEVLSCRYLQTMTQEETAAHLGLTPRHLRREQDRAIGLLARRLWNRWQATWSRRPWDEQAEGVETQSAPETSGPTWSSQLRSEIASLEEHAPSSIADVSEVIAGITSLVHMLASQAAVHFEVGTLAPSLLASIHPSALRQILLHAIGSIVDNMSAGTCLTVSTNEDVHRVGISMTWDSPSSCSLRDDPLIQEILRSAGGTLEVTSNESSGKALVVLPSARTITVLVLDDNADLVHFYKRYVAGTRYSIVHESEGRRALQAIASAKPDIIVLDVMLPDIDGWEVLSQIHEQQKAGSIPVIVCSVIREGKLAIALGASLFVPKPVGRQQFLHALDQAFSRPAIT